MSITDPNDFDRPYLGYVQAIAPVDVAADVFEMRISGAPRGKKLNLQVGGLKPSTGSRSKRRWRFRRSPSRKVEMTRLF